MKDIKTIIEAYDLTDEQKSEIVKAVNDNYKTVEEMAKKNKRIEELETANEELSARIEEMPDTAEVEKLKEQVQEFKAAEKKRKEDEAETKKRADFQKLFDDALDGREFANPMLKETVFEKTYEKCSTTTGASAEDVIKELTDGMDGVWKNPQNDPNKLPLPGQNMSANADTAVKDKKSLADQLFGNIR